MGRQRERERKRETRTEPQRPSASREHAKDVAGGAGVETAERQAGRDRRGKTGGRWEKRAVAEGQTDQGREMEGGEGEGRETCGRDRGRVRETSREEKQTPGRDRDGREMEGHLRYRELGPPNSSEFQGNEA